MRRLFGVLLLLGAALALAWLAAPRGTAAARIRATVDRWVEAQTRVP